MAAATHDTQLGRQIVEQLQGAICLTSQIVEGAEKSIKNALPVGSVFACIKRQSADDNGPSERLVLRDVTQLCSKVGV